MLSYQHLYHAGGFADVHKHAALSLVLDHLSCKDKPFTVIDLYAGSGVYDLRAPEAQKIGEFRGGIAKLPPRALAGALARYAAAVQAVNAGAAVDRYPGSPALARHALRADDRLILNELHPRAHAELKRWAGKDRRLSVHRRDGLEALIALVPPRVRRGVIVIDPSYEIKSEYAAVPAALGKALRKWPEAIALVWFPILANGRQQVLVDGLGALPIPALLAELRHEPLPATGQGVLGSGVAVLNPPFGFENAMSAAGSALAKPLRARTAQRWLSSVTGPAA